MSLQAPDWSNMDLQRASEGKVAKLCFMFAKNPLSDFSGAPRGRHWSDRYDCSCCVGRLNAFVRRVRCCTRVRTKLFYQRGFHGRLVALCSPN